MEYSIKQITTFPADGLYAVHEDEGKYFKTKILAILGVLLSDDTLNFKIITPMDVKESYLYNLTTDGLSSDINFIGIIDNHEDWVEIPKFDKDGFRVCDIYYQKDIYEVSQYKYDLFYCETDYPWHLDIAGTRFTDPIGPQWHLIAENISNELSDKFMYSFLPESLGFDTINEIPKKRPKAIEIKKAWFSFISKNNKNENQQ